VHAARESRPAVLASYAIVGERLQGSLEPILAMPIRHTELLLGKATAAFLPAVTVAYLVLGVYAASSTCSPTRSWPTRSSKARNWPPNCCSRHC
jgi:ABC-type Na+ efflux pump permease subunit